MRALVTGGAGFAGSYLVEYLLRQGQEVIVVDRKGERLANLDHLPNEVRLERGDLLDPSRMRQILEDTRPQRIYHLAALSSPQDSFENPKLAYDVNFTGTLNLLCAWRELGIESRFLLVSSVAVYGPATTPDVPLREDAPLRPASPYAGSKAAAEMLALQFFQAYGLPVIRVRPFNHTGPRQMPSYVCSSFARQVAEIDLHLRSPQVSVGNLRVRRDFSDVRDIVRGYYLLLEKGEAGDVYQLCSGVSVSIESILHRLIALSSQPIRVSVDDTRLRSEESPLICGDPSKARRAVGWQPEYDFEVTLRDLKLYWETELRKTLGPGGAGQG
jgi:GDP-4-dehydro-6-deoxy-D-mannose reductase